MRKSIFYAIVLIGITAISGQIILIRELFTAFYGNELSIGFILATWLLGGALGSGLLGKFFVDKIRKKLFLFSSAQIAVSIFFPASVIFARISKVLLGSAQGEIVGLPIFLLSAFITLIPLAVLLGFLFVLGCKILPDKNPSVGIGKVYTLEAFGAVVGGAITSLILIRYLGALQIVFILSFLNLFSAYGVLDRAAKWLRKTSLLLTLILALFVLLGGVELLDKQSMRFRWKGFTVIQSKDSIYGRIAVTSRGGQLDFFNNGVFLFSSHDPLSAEETVHFPMAYSENPKKVLLIGGGVSAVTAEILKYPVHSIDYVELDPLIIGFAKIYLGEKPFYKLNDPRVKVWNVDGRFFIKNTESTYNVVIIDLPNPYTAQINRFYTKEFFKELKRVLSKNAVVAFAVSSSENYLSKEQARFLKSLFETAKSEFAHVTILPGDTAHFLLSDKKNAPFNAETIVNRLTPDKIKTFYVRDYYLFSKFSDERIAYLRSALERCKGVGKNLDFYPISYFYDMVLWTTYFTFKPSGFLMKLTRLHLLFAALFLYVSIFAIFFIRKKSKNIKRETALLALSTTGLSEIAFQVLIVLAFQIIYGYLYYKVGIIVTSFMFGLALGSFYITKRLEKISSPFKQYIKIQALVLVYPIVLLVSFKGFLLLSANPAFNRIGANLFSVLPFLAGFVGGMQYPLANRICLEEDKPVTRTAGTTYAVDLFGSFVGALLLSTFFVPIVGIPLTCFLVVALNMVSLVLLILARG